MERELKFSLSPAAYNHFRTLAPRDSRALQQRNVYFDDEQGLVERLQLSVRVRIYSHKNALFTVKGGPAHTRDDSPLFVREEHECFLLSRIQADALCSGQLAFSHLSPHQCRVRAGSAHPLLVLKRLLGSESAVAQLRPIAANTTQRVSFYQKIAGVRYVLELDRTSYPRGHIGYELEVELPEGADREIPAITAWVREQIGDDFVPARQSKGALTMQLLRSNQGAGVMGVP